MDSNQDTHCGPTSGAGPTNGVVLSNLPVASNRLSKHYSHVFASDKNSSKRTRAAFMSSMNADKARPVKAKKQAITRRNKKLQRIHETHKTVEIPPGTPTFSAKEVAEKVLVFDGGSSVSTLLSTTLSDSSISPCNVCDSLHIPDSGPDLGLILPHGYDVTGPPIFVRPPRNETLRITGLHSSVASNLLCPCFLSALDHTKFVNKRGRARRTFTLNKVANLGSQACLGRTGVRQDSYHKANMPSSDWDNIIDHIRRSETLYKHVMHPAAIRHTTEARHAVKYNLMLPNSGLKSEGTTIFSAINITQDAYLRAHTDNDFTYAIVSAHLPDHQYSPDDAIIAYFCFPTLGVAVPLRPGDQLIFSPQVPHCLSSRCNIDQTVISTSIYLKGAVVGLNNNTLQLTPQQQNLENQFDL